MGGERIPEGDCQGLYSKRHSCICLEGLKKNPGKTQDGWTLGSQSQSQIASHRAMAVRYEYFVQTMCNFQKIVRLGNLHGNSRDFSVIEHSSTL